VSEPAVSDLVFCAGTALAAPLVERARAAAAAGFTAISLWAEDVERARADGHTDGDLRALLDQLGLHVAELDGVSRWLPGADALPFGRRIDDYLAIARILGGRSINVMEIVGQRPSLDETAAAFAALCEQALPLGLLVHLEFLPWSSVPDLKTAWDIVDRAGCANGGLMLDTWHFLRSGGRPEDLRAVPGERIFAVQLSDAPAAPDGHVMDETLHRRRLPGDGDARLVEIVRTLDAIGCTAPLGVEVFSDTLAALPVDEIARRAAASTRAVLAQARP
jgi:sugar phosphate isomerase/epimerase